jgi:hypothetical protein
MREINLKILLKNIIYDIYETKFSCMCSSNSNIQGIHYKKMDQLFRKSHVLSL